MNDRNSMRNLNENLFGPQGTENIDPENFFHAADQYKKRKCRWGFIKCCGGIALCATLNAVSFYLGYVYAIKDDYSNSL
tara:strand:+ start:132 stop:368 length:237 start_codon:yes stop_codon:yes gene_type:complete